MDEQEHTIFFGTLLAGGLRTSNVFLRMSTASHPLRGCQLLKSPPKTSQLNAVPTSRDSGDAAMPSYSRLSSFVPAMAKNPDVWASLSFIDAQRPYWKWNATIG